MKIDWNKLKLVGQIDYYSVTIQNETIQKERAYYLRDTKALFTTHIAVLDRLILNGYARCFSDAIGTDGNYSKLDFLLQSDYHSVILEEIMQGVPFFCGSVISEFDRYILENDIPLINNVMGATVYQDRNLKDICLYYKNSKPERSDWFLRFLDRYGINYKYLSELKNFGWVYLIAFDFSDDLMKLKVYFKFNKKYRVENLIPLFDNINNRIAEELINTNGFIEGLQFAFSHSELLSYNFYFKEDIIETDVTPNE